MQKHGPVAPMIRNTSLVPDEQGRGEHRDEAEGVMLRQDGEEMDMDLGGPGLGFGFDEDDENMRPPPESQAGSNQIQQPDVHYTPISIPGHVYPPIDSHPDSVVAPSLRDNDPSFLQLAYLQAVLHNVRSKMSVQKSSESLEMMLDVLKAARCIPEDCTPVKTLQSAKRRLGLNPDTHIIQYSICPQCWRHYNPQEVRELESPACTSDNCDGVVYTEKCTASGDTKQHPIKIIPQVSLIQSL
ncbi:hypothetical protein Moror_9063 [Moniliophthora roreri MCA 2997]|uniref:Uncharacterized protein n=2 Tax=Moniliophthora roreri TaxID=221103 RepID=V2XGP7_MONRO|nr:hypothetical protein Moror_9063 [Moniliophthora roreri MCA 2997]